MKIKADELKSILKGKFVDIGFDLFSAECATECMVDADLYGVDTHGTTVAKAHIDRAKSGGYNLSPCFSIEKETAAFALINADNAIGFASATYCMKYAINNAKKSGIYTVLCNNANTYGAAFCYALQAAKEGMIGFTMSNSPAAMAPIGGKTKLLGTNPFSLAIPALNEKHIIIDMATSKVAKSKFLQAKREGKELPDGWALDKNGIPTTDPDEAIQGLVCPMEGHKGYAIAMAIDVVAGLLSGAAFAGNVQRFYSEKNKCMDVGHYFCAINPEIIFGTAFYKSVDEYIESIRNSELADECDSINLPGDRKHSNYERNIKDGIEVGNWLKEW